MASPLCQANLRQNLTGTATAFEIAAPARPKTTVARRAPLLPTDLQQRLVDVETELLEAALERAKFNQRLAADLLGLSYHQFRGKLRKFGIRGKP